MGLWPVCGLLSNVLLQMKENFASLRKGALALFPLMTPEMQDSLKKATAETAAVTQKGMVCNVKWK